MNPIFWVAGVILVAMVFLMVAASTANEAEGFADAATSGAGAGAGGGRRRRGSKNKRSRMTCRMVCARGLHKFGKRVGKVRRNRRGGSKKSQSA